MLVGLRGVISAGTIAYTIITWISKARHVDPHRDYQALLRDVRVVSDALERIRSQVGSLSTNRLRTLKLSDDGEVSTLDLAINGLNETLKRCEALLRDHPHFEKAEGGIIVKIRWSRELEERVKGMQNQMSFHASKLNLVMEPLRLCIYGRLETFMADVNARFDRVEDKLGIPAPPVTAVPTELDALFSVEAAVQARSSIEGLQDHVDAVVHHYKQSTKHWVEEPPFRTKPPAQQYLNLFKCRWLLQRMQQDRSFARYCQDPLPREFLRELDRQIESEFDRFQAPSALQAPSLEEMRAESGNDLQIWVKPVAVDVTPAVTEPLAGEQKLFKAPLKPLVPNIDRILTLFRSNENIVRFVISSSLNVAGTDLPDVDLDCRRMVLKPLYARPDNRSPRSLTWQSGPGIGRGKELAFENISGLVQFQQAITNFNIRSKLRKIETMHYGDSQLGTQGNIQLWLYSRSALPEQEQRQLSTGTDSSSSRSGSTRSSSVSSRSRNLFKQKNPSSTVRTYQCGNFLDEPVPAQLVIYTCKQSRLRLVSIAVDYKTIINPQLCNCSSCVGGTPSQCKQIVLEQKTGDLQLRIFDTACDDGTEDESRFNVALLRHPPHEHAKAWDNGQSYNHVTLTLENAEARKDFCEEFEEVRHVMNKRMASYSKDYTILGKMPAYEKR